MGKLTTRKEKGRKHDGISRVSNDVYRKGWDEIFGNKNVVITDASFTSRDYGTESNDEQSE